MKEDTTDIVPMRPAGVTLTNDGKSREVTKVTEKVTDVTEKRILELLKDNAKHKTVELAEMLDISRKTVSVKLKNLKEKGIIERVGSDSCHWGWGNRSCIRIDFQKNTGCLYSIDGCKAIWYSSFP